LLLDLLRSPKNNKSNRTAGQNRNLRTGEQSGSPQRSAGASRQNNGERQSNGAQRFQAKRNKEKVLDVIVEQTVEAAAVEQAKIDLEEQLAKEEEDESYDLLLMNFDRITEGSLSLAPMLLANSPDLYLFEYDLALFKERDRPRYRALITAFAVAKASLRVDRSDETLRNGTSQQVLHNLMTTALRELKVGDADAVAVLEDARRVFRSGYRTLNETADNSRFDRHGAMPVVEVPAPPSLSSHFTLQNLNTTISTINSIVSLFGSVHGLSRLLKGKMPPALAPAARVPKGPAFHLKGGVAPSQH